MSRRGITVEVGATTFVMRGWRAKELAEAAGAKVIYSGVSNGWIGDEKRVGDLLAYLDYRNVNYTLEDVRQPGLFDGGDAA